MRAKLLAKLVYLGVSVGMLCIVTNPSLTVNKAIAISSDSVPIISQSTRSEAEVWSLLQQAETGYVVLIRHALAPGTGDPANFQLDDCSTQRNLSEAGREQAVQIGEAFKSRQIPIAKVLSSQWCRCLETAELMDIGSVEPLTALNSTFYAPSTETERTAQVSQFIIDNRNTVGTTVMVTHASNISALSGISVRSGAMVVLQADDRQIDLIGQIEAI